jgi:hypothetical protein
MKTKAAAKKAAPAKKVATKKVAAKKGTNKKKGTAMSKAADVPKVNHIIPKALGLEMIARFKKNIKNLSKVKFEMGKEFDKSLFEALLKLKGIQNVRIYNAVNKDNSHTFVLTGLDKNSNELYFKIKQAAKSKQVSQGKDGGDTTTNDDGVGNMGNQCTEPPKESVAKSFYSKL